MKKRILLIGGNYFPEPTGIGKYNGEMVKWLAGEGHSCTVITTFPYYPHWKVQHPYDKNRFWFKTERVAFSGNNFVTVIRCPHYVPRIPTGINRMISEFSFFFTAYLALLVLLFKKKYDNVITVAPPFAIGLLGILYTKIRGGKSLYHIQDLQVDAARDLDMIKSDLVVRICLSIEKFIIKHADCVSTISTGMIEKVKIKCKKEVLLFPNWVDIDSFYPVNRKNELKTRYGFNIDDRIILYAGAIGHKQGLETILQAAKAVEEKTHIKFAICGSGPYKDKLIEYKNEMGLKNVHFLPLQPLDIFNSFLNMADIHLVIQKIGASDLVLPSKLSAILAVGGVPIVTASKGTSLHDIMSAVDMGILIEPENLLSLVSAINNTKDIEIEKKGKNARSYAERNLCKQKILSGFFDQIFHLESKEVKKPVGRFLSRTVESIG